MDTRDTRAPAGENARASWALLQIGTLDTRAPDGDRYKTAKTELIS